MAKESYAEGDPGFEGEMDEADTQILIDWVRAATPSWEIRYRVFSSSIK